MFSNVVLNVFNNPKNTGRISKPDGIADLYNEDNTAHVEFSFRVGNGIISNCQFRAQANPYIVAICSTMTNMLKGQMISAVFLDPYSIKKELGDESDYNIDFCIDCVKLAVEDYKERLEKEQKIKSKQENEEHAIPVEQIEENKDNADSKNEDKIPPIDDDFSDFFDDEDFLI